MKKTWNLEFPQRRLYTFDGKCPKDSRKCVRKVLTFGITKANRDTNLVLYLLETKVLWVAS